MSWNEAEIAAARRVIFQVAQDMLAEKLSYVEGARKIHVSMWAAKVNEADPDLVPFRAIVSETDAVPI